MPKEEKFLRDKILGIGKRLYTLRLVSGPTGNLSARLDKNNILITATGACLGDLRSADIIKVGLNVGIKPRNISSEFPLHRLIYINFPVKAVIHCHPPLTNAYFSVYSQLKALTGEARLYLNRVPLIEQRTFAISQPQKVIEALKDKNIVVVRNHGVVSAGEDFKEILHLIEILEESVKVAAVARLFKKKILDNLDKTLKKSIR